MMKTLKLYIALAGIFLTVRLLAIPVVTDVSDPVNTIGTLTLSPVAALRVSGLGLPFTAVPSTLLGNTLISVSRGDRTLPGHGYSFHVHQSSTLYLFVMQRGTPTPTPPTGWQVATGLTTSWWDGSTTFHDTVYTRTTSNDETVTIPVHNGTDGSSYGVPDCCVIDDEGIMSMQDLMNPAINEATFGTAPVHSPLTLISNGIPLVTIVIPAGASTGVQSAATDLTKGIYLVTGVNVVTKHEGESFSGLFIKIDDRTYTGYEQGFQTTTSAQGITIIGDSQGVQNGVCDFQERILGIRWYYPGDDGTVYKTKSQ